MLSFVSKASHGKKYEKKCNLKKPALFATSESKINGFWKIFFWSGLEEAPAEWRKKGLKKVDFSLFLKVIMQPPVHNTYVIYTIFPFSEHYVTTTNHNIFFYKKKLTK